MASRIVDGFNRRMDEALANLEQSANTLELVDAFFDQQYNIEKTEILWAEIWAYSSRSETVRDRLKKSYDGMFQSVSEALKRDYPDVPKQKLQTAAYTIAVLLDRSPTFEWLHVQGTPTQLARAVIKDVLGGLV
ncbi:MAG: hypothetical protein AAFY17_13995 [Cyanobacteria bacterium J06642_11]